MRLAPAFRILLSENGVVALEGVSIHLEVKRILQPYVVSPTLDIRPGTLYPTPEWLHVRASANGLTTLNELANSFAGPEVCNHLYGYEDGALLFEWHDAFSDPIQVDGSVSVAAVTAFCSELRVDPPKNTTSRGQ
jgi:hypothetical protein